MKQDSVGNIRQREAHKPTEGTASRFKADSPLPLAQQPQLANFFDGGKHCTLFVSNFFDNLEHPQNSTSGPQRK